MAQKGVLVVGAAVDIEHNLAVVDLHVRQHQAVARLGGSSGLGDHLQIRLARRLQLAVGHQRQALVPLGKWPHGKALLRLHDADDFQAVLGVHRSRGQLHLGRLDLGKTPIDRGRMVGIRHVPRTVDGHLGGCGCAGEKAAKAKRQGKRK